MKSRPEGVDLQEFLDILSELRGVLDMKIVRGENEAWIGLRVGRQRPPHVLLHQVNRAAVGFGLDTNSVHFGILAD